MLLMELLIRIFHITAIRHNAFHGNNNRYKVYEDLSPKRMVDITRDKPIKVGIRVIVPVRDHPKFNFVGKLLGPKGNSLKRLQEETMTKMAILGRGSMRDRHKEEELRNSGDPRFGHLLEDLHVEITAFAPPAEAHARIAYALSEVRRFLVPDYNDEIRQEQMWEMQILNTSSSSSTSTLNNAGLRNSGSNEYALNAPNNNNGGGNQENGNDAAADMLMNGNGNAAATATMTTTSNASPSPSCSAAMAAMSGLLAASAASSAAGQQLNLDSFNHDATSPHGFAPLASPNGPIAAAAGKFNNGFGQLNGNVNMEYCGAASSSNGSLSPPEFNNPISSSSLLMSPHSAIRGFKAKSPGASSSMNGRKRPLLSGGSAADIMGAEPAMRPPGGIASGGPIGPGAGHMFMSPSKRTVLSILAKAKAAQHKDPIAVATAAAVAASGYKHHPHITGHHGLTGMPPAPFRKSTLFPNPANLLLN